jgi:hypothetical protein
MYVITYYKFLPGLDLRRRLVKGPMRRIVGWVETPDRRVKEVLDCGHTVWVQTSRQEGRTAMWRRACIRCEQGLPPDVDPYGASVLRMGVKA